MPVEFQGHNRQNPVYASLIITLILATVTTFLRFVARWKTGMSLWWDDYLAIAAWLSALIWNIVLFVWLSKGFGYHLADIDLPQAQVLRTSYLILWISELSYGLSLGFVKCSLLSFYWRLFKTSKIRLPIQILFGVSIVWCITRTFIAIFHCWPVEAFWDSRVGGTCTINDSKFFFGSVFAHLIIDIVIIILPVIQVRKLQLPSIQKIGVGVMFVFGVFVCLCSIFVLHEAVEFDATSIEVNYNLPPVWVWGTAELNLATVSACLPILRPIVSMCTGRTGSSYERTTDCQKTGHKLSTFTKPRTTNHESDSTHRFAAAGAQESGERSSSEDQIYNTNSGKQGGTKTIITGWNPRRGTPDAVHVEHGFDGNGVNVTSDVTVHVSEA